MDFTGAFLAGVNFQNSRCEMSNFSGAFLGRTNFMNVDLSNCSFEGAKFNGTSILESAFVDNLDWLEILNGKSQDFDLVIQKYTIDPNAFEDKFGYTKYKIIRRNT